jgi:hypothetical protein
MPEVLMSLSRRRFLIAAIGATALTACGGVSPRTRVSGGLYPGETPQMRALIVKWALIHEIPESLLHRQIQRESDYRADARNGPYWGLMQILPQTARTMGYEGPPEGLLDAETNLKYAGRCI